MSDALCQELAGVSEFVNAKVAAGQSRDDVMEAMFSSCMVRLSAATHVTGSKQKLAVTNKGNYRWTVFQVSKQGRGIGGAACMQHRQALRN